MHATFKLLSRNGGGLRSLDDQFSDDGGLSEDLDAECKVKPDNRCTPISISSNYDDCNEHLQVLLKTEDVEVKPLRTMQTVRADTSKTRCSVNRTSDLMKTIANAFDSNSQLTRDRNRS